MDKNGCLTGSGVYRLDFPYGYFYVGQASNLKHRWAGHKNRFRKKERNSKLYNVWAKHGDPEIRVLEYCPVAELADVEQRYITEHWGDPLLCNTSPDSRTNRGVKLGYETAKKGRPFTEQHKKKLSEVRKAKALFGTKALNAKLTEDQVLEIRQRYSKQVKGSGSTTLAKEYGVSYRTILYIVNNERYANI